MIEPLSLQKKGEVLLNTKIFEKYDYIQIEDKD